MNPAPAAPAIQTTAPLGKRYRTRWALAGVELAVSPATATMVFGSNGSGKTTLLRLLGTAIRPDLGDALVLGQSITTSRDAVRRVTGSMGHTSYAYESLTALENLQIAARFLELGAGKPALMKILDGVGLASRANDPLLNFSAGMKKRLAFARLILQRPLVVLLDEPYGNLDPAGFNLVDTIVEDLKGAGSTLVIATHHMERMAGLCDRAVFLEGGRLAWEGAARQYSEAASALDLRSERA